MIEFIVLDGIAPTYYWRNAGIVIGFEMLTLIIETTIFYLIFVNRIKTEQLKTAIATILVANAITFLIGAGIYTALYGHEWLFTSWGTTQAEDFLMLITIIWVVPLFAFSLALFLIIGEKEWTKEQKQEKE